MTQPLFFPYAGYFRLAAEVDEFVIFDCVQFPRRGRVHRCQVPGPGGDTEWLTLPLAKQPRSILIRDLEFAADARKHFDRRLRRLPWILQANGPCAETLREFLFAPLKQPLEYLESTLILVAELLGLHCRFSRSSELAIDPSIRGQQRVIEVARRVGADEYLNAPSGRSFYDPESFAAANIDLRFLHPYEGRYFQMLPALMEEDPRAIVDDLRKTAGSERA